ncbi:MAG TPA: amidohydrolase family protein, partial [Puia sp.]|nr:amidohydrolase family protein [Puia sp.]
NKIFLSFISLCLVCVCYSQTRKDKFTIIITNANIVDVVNNKIIPHQLIAISGNTISAVDEVSKVNHYKADRYIDAKNHFILPGLWDMHMHFRGGDSLIEANKKLLTLFLAYGVTTVRECGGDITSTVLTWKKQILQGELVGPKIFTSGPKIDGPKAYWAGSLEVETPTQVSQALDSLQKLNVDFVKVYDSKISREAYLEIITQAHQRGMKITGHMPFTVKLTEGVERGMNGSEHMFNVYKACSSKEDSITNLIQERAHTDKPIPFYTAVPYFYDSYDENKANELFVYLARNKFTITPTLFVVQNDLVDLKYHDHSADSLLSYIDPKIQATYQLRLNLAKKQSDEMNVALKKFMVKTNSMVPQMYAAGVNILAGSDCGAFNSFMYPGESLHEELKLMVTSGLTPSQALQTAIINGAKFMGVANFYGSIQKGKSSDIMVLDANPLTDIQAIDQIDMVISNGRLYTKSDLNNLLRSIKN